MDGKDSNQHPVKDPSTPMSSEELKEHSMWSSEPPHDGFPSSPDGYSTGARRPQIGGVYLSKMPGYRAKMPEDKKRVGPTDLDKMPTSLDSSSFYHTRTVAMEASSSNSTKQPKNRGTVEKKASPQGSLSPDSKIPQMNSPSQVSPRKHANGTDMSEAASGGQGYDGIVTAENATDKKEDRLKVDDGDNEAGVKHASE